jgi:hypothetical protein
MMGLLENDIGGGYCHAWYARRFLQSVVVTETRLPHSSLGLSRYVQWTSPIRRFGDLQVQAAVKRFIRRKRVYEMICTGQTLPSGVSSSDLGLQTGVWNDKGQLAVESFEAHMLDQDINYLEGVGLAGAAKTLMRQSQQYWLFEYIKRLKDVQPDRVSTFIMLKSYVRTNDFTCTQTHKLQHTNRHTKLSHLDAQTPKEVTLPSISMSSA